MYNTDVLTWLFISTYGDNKLVDFTVTVKFTHHLKTCRLKAYKTLLFVKLFVIPAADEGAGKGVPEVKIFGVGVLMLFAE